MIENASDRVHCTLPSLQQLLVEQLPVPVAGCPVAVAVVADVNESETLLAVRLLFRIR